MKKILFPICLIFSMSIFSEESHKYFHSLEGTVNYIVLPLGFWPSVLQGNISYGYRILDDLALIISPSFINEQIYKNKFLYGIELSSRYLALNIERNNPANGFYIEPSLGAYFANNMAAYAFPLSIGIGYTHRFFNGIFMRSGLKVLAFEPVVASPEKEMNLMTWPIPRFEISYGYAF